MINVTVIDDEIEASMNLCTFNRFIEQKNTSSKNTNEMSDITLFKKTKKSKKVDEEPQKKRQKVESSQQQQQKQTRPTTFDESIFAKEQPVTNNDSDSEDEQPQSDTPSFNQLGLSPWLCDHLEKLKMSIPTIIQQQCIPQSLQKKNIIAMSKTGSGKTAAFALPIIEHLAKDMFGVYALVVTPTRELALQIKANFVSLSGDLPVRVALMTGGMNYMKQTSVLSKRPHIVVGTPGRIEETLRLFEKEDYFKRLKYLVFDEADRLLSEAFSLDIGSILKSLPPASQRQTMLYSATMNSQVKKLANTSLQKDQREENKLFIFDACRLYDTADNLKQYYLFMPHAVKDCYIYKLLDWMQNEKENVDNSVISMIFFSNTNDCELVCRTMKLLGLDCESLHSAKPQRDRFQVLRNFKSRKVKTLFCTDVANRGLDIPSVNYVINYDLPNTTDTYVHRVGRTARAGRGGISISLVSQHDVEAVRNIESQTKVTMKNFAEKHDFLDRKQVEDLLYDIAEKRAYAKIELLKSGFQEEFENVKNKQKLSADLLNQASVHYEKQYMEQLKGGTKWLDKLKHKSAQKHHAMQEEKRPKLAYEQAEAASDSDEEHLPAFLLYQKKQLKQQTSHNKKRKRSKDDDSDSD
jgi:ATP-dependent RNA helicase DDX49/DBP8